MIKEQDIIETPEAAKLYGVHQVTMRALAASGSVPGCRKVGRRWLWSRSILIRFIQQGGKKWAG